MMTLKQKRQAKLEAKLQARHEATMAAEMARMTTSQYVNTQYGFNDNSGSWDGQNRDSK